MKSVLFTIFIFFFGVVACAQTQSVSKVWVPDNGNGTYKNPIINADYSDPDAIRVGNDFYLVSSSFEDIPGLPILHSKDLVNWTIIGHALMRQPPYDHFSKPQHGDGVWAPAIRFHKGEFYIYYPDPDFGIYLVKAKNPAGPWSDPVLVYPGKGLIDPCPLWDNDGNVYLVHAFAGSRVGIKSIIVVNKLNAEGNKVIDAGKIVYDGHEKDPTIEGPKFYKRNGYYYIFAPAGGVSTGWQLVLRSKNVYGPYERKVVMHQGSTNINGPHQGAWVTTQMGENWFLHFQDKGPYGRLVHLQPMHWKNNWPVIGIDKNGDGTGEPVMVYKKPDVGKTYPITTPQESDEFNENRLGLQWQWMANPESTWYYMNATNGTLRLYSQKIPDSANNLWDVPNVLLQKFPAEEFMITTKMNFHPNEKLENEKAGLTIMGMSYADLALKKIKGKLYLVFGVCENAEKGSKENEKVITEVKEGNIYLRVKVMKDAKCQFSFSFDGTEFKNMDETFMAREGRWIGAKVGLFCTRESQTNDSGYADFDWFRITAIP
ncbi:MAG: glycoside hydrolase 43 family protein [Bacteroidota bacterium]|nr:glycoside hydrolase 43 family protein [Bacteroidota bacterium]